MPLPNTNNSTLPVRELPSSVANRGQLDAPSRTPHIWYSSNPFLAIIQGLVIALLENSVPILLIPIVALGASVVTGLIPILLGNFISGAMFTAVVGIWTALQVFIGVFALSLHLQLMMASFHQERISVSKAIERTLSRPGSFLMLALVCLFPILLPLALIFLSSSPTTIIIGGVLLIPGFTILARLWLSFFFFYENQYTFTMSFIDSWELTRGRSFEMLGVVAAQLPMCFIGVLSPLVATSGFTTRYFQLRYLKSHGFEKLVKTHWANYVLTALLVLGSAYVVAWRFYRAVDNGREVCYSTIEITNDGQTLTSQVCLPKTDCELIADCRQQFGPADPAAY